MFSNLSSRQKVALWGALLLFLLVVVYLVVLTISRAEETKVVITAIPHDSKVLVDGRQVEAGTIYIKPGDYTFVATHSGFKDDTLSVAVGKEAVTVDLIPDPDSQEARDFLKRNPSVQLAREAVGGRRANQQGLKIEEHTPLITALPYTDITGPFSLDYGVSPTDKDRAFILVSDSSPEGRVKALNWIREQGYDPTDFEITFEDFVNPLLETAEAP